MNPKEIFKLKEHSGPWQHFEDSPDVQDLTKPGKPCMVAVWARGQYGLVYKNKRTQKSFNRADDMDSKGCCHIQILENQFSSTEFESESSEKIASTVEPKKKYSKFPSQKNVRNFLLILVLCGLPQMMFIKR